MARRARLSVSRIDGHALCFTLTLGAPPRADSTYAIGIVRELGGQAETGTGFGIAIDGVGGLHIGRDGESAIVTPSITSSLPRYGIAGTRLEFAVAAPWPRQPHAEFHVQASTGSLQTDEPLLTHPLDAGDLIVPDRGCLRFPGGGITLAGICANVPGP